MSVDAVAGRSVAAIAAEVLGALASHTQVTPFTARPGGLAEADAARVLPLLRAGFEARGEKIVGRKFGFTNRSIWPQYGVYAPNWGYITDKTTRALADAPARAADFAEPRIEPEIMFGLKAAPTPAMDDAALLACIDWVALGYEIVQSIFPDWKFRPADTVAANAMHGALLIGARHSIAPRKIEWLRELATFTADLYCDGALIERGGGASVLEGALSTLRYVAALLAKDPDNPPLAAGEIVSTGTLTKAMPVKVGETWTTTVSGIALETISIRFV